MSEDDDYYQDEIDSLEYKIGNLEELIDEIEKILLKLGTDSQAQCVSAKYNILNLINQRRKGE